MLKDLVACGGDANRPDAQGRTPRGMARRSGKKELVAVLAG
jgi:hypothetical protein